MELVGTNPLPEAQQAAPGHQNVGLGGGYNGDILRLRNADAWVPTDLEFAPQGQDLSRVGAEQGSFGKSLSHHLSAYLTRPPRYFCVRFQPTVPGAMETDDLQA